MKRFRFTLPALKTLRERREQEALENYAKAIRIQRQAETELAQSRQDLETAQEERQTRLNQGVTAIETVHILAYCQRLQLVCRDKENALARANLFVRQKWDLLLVARQKREVVDKFFERQKSRHQMESRREEQKMLDELSGHEPESALSISLTVNQTLPT